MEVGTLISRLRRESEDEANEESENPTSELKSQNKRKLEKNVA